MIPAGSVASWRNKKIIKSCTVQYHDWVLLLSQYIDQFYRTNIGQINAWHQSQTMSAFACWECFQKRCLPNKRLCCCCNKLEKCRSWLTYKCAYLTTVLAAKKRCLYNRPVPRAELKWNGHYIPSARYRRFSAARHHQFIRGNPQCARRISGSQFWKMLLPPYRCLFACTI